MKKNILFQKRSIDTKNLIIKTAEELFVKYGYKKTSTILISKEANISVGIIYNYFNNKEELFELWLNNLLERLDNYLYNQFKLMDYKIELPLVISNILDKLSFSFFSLNLCKEEKTLYLDKTLSSFFDKGEKIFLKCCLDNNIFLKYPNETTHLIFHLIQNYNEDLLNNKFNKTTLKARYVETIYSLITR